MKTLIVTALRYKVTSKKEGKMVCGNKNNQSLALVDIKPLRMWLSSNTFYYWEVVRTTSVWKAVHILNNSVRLLVNLSVQLK